MNGEITVLEDELNRVMSAALDAGLEVTNDRAFVHAEMIVNPDELQRVLKALRSREFTVTSVRKHTVAEHPESFFIRLWKQGTALELARGLRFALDVEVGAAKVASLSGRE